MKILVVGPSWIGDTLLAQPLDVSRDRVGDRDGREAALILVRGDELGAIGIGPSLLPDRRRFPRDQAVEPREIAVIGLEFLAVRLRLDEDCPVPLPGIAALERDAERLFGAIEQEWRLTRDVAAEDELEWGDLS